MKKYRFKIGQDVVCVQSHPEAKCPLKKGVVYKVLSYSDCTCAAIDVGIIDPELINYQGNLRCGDCHKPIIKSMDWFILESRFAPLKSDGSHLALCATVEQEALEELKLEEIEQN